MITALRRDRGAMAIEYVILAPMILLVFALIWLYGRRAEASGTLDSGTRDAARLATQARSMAQAQQVADSALAEALGSQCTSVPIAQISTDPPSSDNGAAADRFAPGYTLTVKATCNVAVSDLLGFPGTPGSLSITSMFSSVIDPNRGVT